MGRSDNNEAINQTENEQMLLSIIGYTTNLDIFNL